MKIVNNVFLSKMIDIYLFAIILFILKCILKNNFHMCFVLPQMTRLQLFIVFLSLKFSLTDYND